MKHSNKLDQLDHDINKTQSNIDRHISHMKYMISLIALVIGVCGYSLIDGGNYVGGGLSLSLVILTFIFLSWLDKDSL